MEQPAFFKIQERKQNLLFHCNEPERKCKLQKF